MGAGGVTSARGGTFASGGGAGGAFADGVLVGAGVVAPEVPEPAGGSGYSGDAEGAAADDGEPYGDEVGDDAGADLTADRPEPVPALQRLGLLEHGEPHGRYGSAGSIR